MAKGSLIVLGSGPGIGVTTAALLASKGFTSIALLSRNAERLKEDVATVQKANSSAKVQPYAVDIGDTAALQTTLKQTEADLGPPEFVFFNAARIKPSPIGEETADNLQNDFKLMNVGLYTAIVWAEPHLVKLAQDIDAHPSFMWSNGAIHQNPRPPVFGLAMQKAAQTALMKAFSKVAGPQGVHVAGVNIGGVVKDSEPTMNRTNIAQMFYELYSEKKSDWRFSLDCGQAPEFKVEK